MFKLYLLLVLVAALFLSCVAIGFGDADTCGGEKYTSGSQICENDVLKNPCGIGYYAPSMQFCYNNVIYEKCDHSNYNLENQICEDEIIKTRCGTGNGYHNPATQFCNGNDVVDKCGGKNYNPSIEGCYIDIIRPKCGENIFDPSIEACFDGIIKSNKMGIFTDSRDGKIYKYIGIGNQIWMAENLQYEATEAKCCDNDINNCEMFGALYDKNTAKTVCPSDWHLPSDNEWEILADYVGGYDIAGTKLKATSGWNDYEEQSGNGTDDFGFTALPSWCSYIDEDHFTQIKKIAYFWSSSVRVYANGSANKLWALSDANSSLDLREDIAGRKYFFSVRCIKD
jgi:uncharacterized protein (TIGR02145 family)